MATSTTVRTTAPALPAARAARDRALALRRRLLPLAAAWALLVTLPMYWIVVGEVADSVTGHGTHRFAGRPGSLLAGLFLLVLLAPCVASAGLSLLAWHRAYRQTWEQGADVGRGGALLLLPGGLAGGVVGWSADQVVRGPVLAATGVLVAALVGGAAVVGLAARRRQPPGVTNPVS